MVKIPFVLKTLPLNELLLFQIHNNLSYHVSQERLKEEESKERLGVNWYMMDEKLVQLITAGDSPDAQKLVSGWMHEACTDMQPLMATVSCSYLSIQVMLIVCIIYEEVLLQFI